MANQLTYGQFAALVLAGMGAPVTQNNINKISAIGVQEGSHGAYNIMNWVLAAPGATDYNGVGVKNYPNLQTGVAQTIAGLNQGNTSQMKANLMSDGPYDAFTQATSQFYASWGGGSINVSEKDAQNAATSKLLEGTVGQGDLTNVATSITKDPNGIAAIESTVPGDYNSGITGLLGAVTNVVGGASAVSDAVASAATGPLEFMKAVWSALTSRANWVRVGMIVGAVLLAIFGMLIISKSVGGPGASDVAKGAALAV